MKKLLGILVLGFGLIGCDNPDNSTKVVCSNEAAKAKTDTAAKLVYKNCIKLNKEYSKKSKEYNKLSEYEKKNLEIFRMLDKESPSKIKTFSE